MSALSAFRRAQSRVQRANADRRWIESVERRIAPHAAAGAEATSPAREPGQHAEGSR